MERALNKMGLTRYSVCYRLAAAESLSSLELVRSRCLRQSISRVGPVCEVQVHGRSHHHLLDARHRELGVLPAEGQADPRGQRGEELPQPRRRPLDVAEGVQAVGGDELLRAVVLRELRPRTREEDRE